ncbi:MAG: hypothetical protein IPI07_14185 [Flavobacteriales bacterium]|nr:hypothetical protein [Flavobacteriales bacterium]
MQKRTGLWKEPDVPSLSVLSSRTTGALCGEGAAFFVLDDRPGDGPDVRLADLDITYRGRADGLAARVAAFLERNGLTAGDVDLLMLGYNGDALRTEPTIPVLAFFPASTMAAFKHFCGEYCTGQCLRHLAVGPHWFRVHCPGKPCSRRITVQARVVRGSFPTEGLQPGALGALSGWLPGQFLQGTAVGPLGWPLQPPPLQGHPRAVLDRPAADPLVAYARSLSLPSVWLAIS